MVIDFVGLSESTYYDNIKHDRNKNNKSSNNPKGRPFPGYSYHLSGEKIPDEQIKEWIMELINGDGFPYGYRKLTVCLNEDYMLIINKKKVYRLCDDLGVLKTQRRIKKHHPRKLAKRDKVTASNQLWELDVKYGHIAGKDKFFFQLSLIDVLDKTVISYHLGLSCKAEDACRVLKDALAKRMLTKGMDNLPTIRTDNGPQFVSKLFGDTCDTYGLKHQRIPVKSPNMNAHIEAFHSILKEECYDRYEFMSYLQVYEAVSEYMNYYNDRRRHGSIGDKAPVKYYNLIQEEKINPQEIIA